MIAFLIVTLIVLGLMSLWNFVLLFSDEAFARGLAFVNLVASIMAIVAISCAIGVLR